MCALIPPPFQKNKNASGRASSSTGKFAASLVMLVLLPVYLPILSGCAAQEHPKAHQGVLDLRGWDFDTKGPVKMGGEWELYWNSFIVSDGTVRDALKPSGYIQSTTWTGFQTSSGEILPAKGYASYRMTILLPDDGRHYALSGGVIESAGRVFVAGISKSKPKEPSDASRHNDLDTKSKTGTESIIEYSEYRMVQKAGAAEKNRKSTIPKRNRLDFPIPEYSRVELIIEIANYHITHGGYTQTPRIGILDQIERQRRQNVAYNFFALGAITIIGIYNFLVFLLCRDDKSPLWLALTCAGLTARTFLQDYGQEIGNTEFAYNQIISIIHLSLPWSIGFFTAFIGTTFPNPYTKRFNYPFFSACIAMGALCLLTPTNIFGNLLFISQTLVVIGAVWIVFSLIKSSIETRSVPAFFSLVSIVIAFAIAINDILYALVIVDTGYYIQYGLSIFILSQGVVLAWQNSIARRHTDILNLELRHQLTSRSEQLFNAMALIGNRSPEQPTLFPDDTLNDRYRIIGHIARGGMGSVYEARRIKDNLRVALKIPIGIEPAVLARLAREAHIVSKLLHPNLVALHDIDISPAGFVYLAMEYVDGFTLQEKISKPVDKRWAISVLEQIASGLLELHSNGIIHRDLKPANVMLESRKGVSRPVVKITDFGTSQLELINRAGCLDSVSYTHVSKQESLQPICQTDGTIDIDESYPPCQSIELEILSQKSAKQWLNSLDLSGGSSPNPVTEKGKIMGTPAYMAPELAYGSNMASFAVDIFSFGTIAYQLLCSKLPFETPPLAQVANDGSMVIPKSFAIECKDLDPKIAELLDSCLDKDSEARPTAKHLLDTMQGLR